MPAACALQCWPAAAVTVESVYFRTTVTLHLRLDLRFLLCGFACRSSDGGTVTHVQLPRKSPAAASSSVAESSAPMPNVTPFSPARIPLGPHPSKPCHAKLCTHCSLEYSRSTLQRHAQVCNVRHRMFLLLRWCRQTARGHRSCLRRSSPRVTKRWSTGPTHPATLGGRA
jgi:hypothetical protein